MSGLMRLVTTAMALIAAALGCDTSTQSPFVMPFSLASSLADLDELLRLQDGVELDVLGPVVEMLGQPVGRRDDTGSLLAMPNAVPCRP